MSAWVRWLMYLPFTIIGRLGGYSSCMHCGVTWNVADGHNIPYSEHGGMFPICNHCFKQLDGEKIFYYCWSLWQDWKMHGPLEFHPDWDDARHEIVDYLISNEKLEADEDGYHGTV